MLFTKWEDNEQKFLHFHVSLPNVNDNKQCKVQITNTTNIQKIFKKDNEMLVNAVEEFIQNGSNGWLAGFMNDINKHDHKMYFCMTHILLLKTN